MIDKACTVLITGASSGIGLELAKLFARDHYQLVLVARSREALEKLATDLKTNFGASAMIVVVDLSLPQAVEEVASFIDQKHIAIDVLVNNAGFGDFGYFKDTDWAKEEQMMRLNMIALTHLTKIFVRKMVARGQGKILNVASAAGFLPGPLMAVYYATKAYVLHFSEAVANELKGTGVSMTILCPGPTASGFQQMAGLEESGMVRGKKLPTSASVAKSGYRALQKGRTIVITGLKNKCMIELLRITPRFFVRNYVRRYKEDRNS